MHASAEIGSMAAVTWVAIKEDLLKRVGIMAK
jgi:hypothetical protein